MPRGRKRSGAAGPTSLVTRNHNELVDPSAATRHVPHLPLPTKNPLFLDLSAWNGTVEILMCESGKMQLFSANVGFSYLFLLQERQGRVK